MAAVTKVYPNVVKWLKRARAAALKDKDYKFAVNTIGEFTYITDGLIVLRIPAAQFEQWTAVIDLTPLAGQEAPDNLWDTIQKQFCPSIYDEALLDTGVLAYVQCKFNQPLCRVYAYDGRPYVVQEAFVEVLQDAGVPITTSGVLSLQPAKVATDEGLAMLAMPIHMDFVTDWRQKRVLEAAAKTATECWEETLNAK